MKIKVIFINHCFVPSGLYRYFSFNYYCNHNNEILIIARNKWDKRIKPSQSINKKEFIMSKKFIIFCALICVAQVYAFVEYCI